jgi:hypothetical protein
MVSKKLLNNLFKNLKHGDFLLVKEEEKVGYLFEKKEGDIYYKGKYEKTKNKKEFDVDYCGVEIVVKNISNRYIVYPGQKLPTEISPKFFELFKLSHFKNKSELEEKIKEIEIKS